MSVGGFVVRCVGHVRGKLADVVIARGLGPGAVDSAFLLVVVRVVGVVVFVRSAISHDRPEYPVKPVSTP